MRLFRRRITPGKLGCKAKVLDRRNLKLATYLKAGAPLVLPAAIDWSGAVKVWGCHANDEIGDCVIAAMANQLECWTANASTEIVVSDDVVKSAYAAITGWNPNDPSTDNGTDVLSACKYWKSTGLGAHTIDAYVEVSTDATREVKACIAWFGGIGFSLNLPRSAMGSAVWDGSGDTNIAGGHQVFGVGYTLRCGRLWYTIISWGQVIQMSDDFLKAYGYDAVGAVSKDWLNTAGISPSGLDQVALQSDLRNLETT